MNGVTHDAAFRPENAKLQINRWILTELTKTAREVADGIDQYRFNEAASAAYRFVWNNFCDWYLELLKPVFNGDDEDAKAEAQACAAHVLDGVYKLLHPFMPFMTEELWALTAEARYADLPRGMAASGFRGCKAPDEINWLIDLVSGIRSVRAEMNVPASAMVPLVMVGATTRPAGACWITIRPIGRLARVEDIILESEVPKGSAQLVIGEATACLPLGGLIDVDAERARLGKAIGKVEADIDRLGKKLGNEKFLANAKPEIVAGEREKLEDAQREA
jgi:valyl-tRNA synthetase